MTGRKMKVTKQSTTARLEIRYMVDVLLLAVRKTWMVRILPVIPKTIVSAMKVPENV